MSAVQNVGPFFNFGNVKVVKTSANYSLSKDDGIVIVDSSGNTINVTLPANPEDGETHRVLTAAGTHVNALPNTDQQILFNPEGTGPITAPPATCIVPEGTIVDFTWNSDNSEWVASCCAQHLLV